MPRLRFAAQRMKCNLITHERDLASSLCSADDVIVTGHPKCESAWGDATHRAARAGVGCGCSARLSLQMCPPCRCALPLAVAATLAFHSPSSFERTSCSETGPVPLSDRSDTPLYTNRLNLCGMWFHSADLDCAAQARHTPAWRESWIPFSAKDAEANINQTGNQKADGLFLSKLRRPLIPVYPFSTRCFTCLIEAQVIETQLAEGDKQPRTEIRTSVSVTHEVTCMETASQDLQKAEGTRPARKPWEKSAAQTDKSRKKRGAFEREIG